MGLYNDYAPLEAKLFEQLRAKDPDFETAKELIRQGADVNAVTHNGDDNLLSELIMDRYPFDAPNPNAGTVMCRIIRFLLENGFDVNANEGRNGAQCLVNLKYSTNDRYIIEGTKILFDAGARNVPTVPNDDDTPWDAIGTECRFQCTCEHDHAIANLYEAVYQIYEAVEDGRPYHGIDSYEAAIGKKVRRVLAEAPNAAEVFYPLDLPTFQKENCFNTRLFFEFDDGCLITTEYADFWFDTFLPEKGSVDVSAHFPGIAGSAITDIRFDHREVRHGRTAYGQPITILETDAGTQLKFSINFGDVQEEDRAAYFEFC